MTLAQKKMAAMIMEGKDVASAAVDSGAVSKEAEEAEMDMSGDEADALAEKVLPTGNGEQSTSTPAAPAAGAIKVGHFDSVEVAPSPENHTGIANH